jgi:hypothetical protein
MYNQLQDNIINTQNRLTTLHTRQARIENLMVRLIESEQISTSNTVANTPNNEANDANEDDENTNTNTPEEPTALNQPQPTTPTTTTTTTTRPNSPNTTNNPTVDQQPQPLNRVLSSIFHNIPNYLPQTTTSSLNPNYRPTNRFSTSNYYNHNNQQQTSYMNNNEPNYTEEHTTNNIDSSQNYISSVYITPIQTYYTSSLSNDISPRTNTQPRNPVHNPTNIRNILTETFTPRNIIESMIFAIMDISTNSIVDEPLTTQEIDNNIQCCEFQDIQNPLNITCPITMDLFQPNTKVIKLINCGHLFTDTELRRWLINKRICPICRHNITEENL